MNFHDETSFYTQAYLLGFRTLHHERLERGSHYVMVNPDLYLILSWDSFIGELNSANLYFNWVGDPDKISGCSGGWRKRDCFCTFAGGKDVRLDLKEFITYMKSGFVKWEYQPFFRLFKHKEYEQPDFDHKEANARIIEHFPEEIKSWVNSPES